jgi:hypothetical protein
MRNLTDPFWMWVKAVLLGVIAIVSAGVVWMKVGGWEVPLLLGLLVWSACRVHYFFFHVLERWVEPGGRFRGIGELVIRSLKER